MSRAAGVMIVFGVDVNLLAFLNRAPHVVFADKINRLASVARDASLSGTACLDRRAPAARSAVLARLAVAAKAYMLPASSSRLARKRSTIGARSLRD